MFMLLSNCLQDQEFIPLSFYLREESRINPKLNISTSSLLTRPIQDQPKTNYLYSFLTAYKTNPGSIPNQVCIFFSLLTIPIQDQSQTKYLCFFLTAYKAKPGSIQNQEFIFIPHYLQEQHRINPKLSISTSSSLLTRAI